MLLKYPLITLKRNKKYAGASIYEQETFLEVHKNKKKKNQCVFQGAIRFLSKPSLLFSLSTTEIYGRFKFGSYLKHAL